MISSAMTELFVQHLERLEAECARFHSSHTQMGDDVELVTALRDQYRQFLDIIAVSVYNTWPELTLSVPL